MHKSEFLKSLAKKHRRTERHYQEAFDEIFSGITDLLKQGKSLHLTGFGTFYIRTHKGGKGLNLHTKKPVTYGPYKLAAFHAGSLLRHLFKNKKK